MNIHITLSGEAAEAVEEMIRRGRAASRTEAIRSAVLDYKEHHLDQEDQDIRKLSSYANRDIWEDEKEDKIWIKYLKEEKK